MKRIILILILLISSINLKAEFDTISVKDDYRLIDHHYKVMNDSMIITYIALLPYPDSLPTEEFDIRLVNYNVNSMTYTLTYELPDSSQYEFHDFVLSDDRSRILLYPNEKKYIDSLVRDFYNDSLYVYNTSDGSLDSIITLPDLRFDKDIKQLSDGKAGFLAESSSITTRWGRPQKYIGQIDLNNYSSTFFPINPEFESYGEDIVDFNLNKSYHDGFDKEVLLHSVYKDNDGSVSAPFDSNLIRRHDITHISRSLDSGCFWFNYNSETIINKRENLFKPLFFQNDRYYAFNVRFYDSKEENDKDLYIKEHKSDFSVFLGFSKNEEFLFYKSYLKEVPDSNSKVIIIYDYENNSNIDSMIFRIKKHPIFGFRDYKNLKFLNDSIAIGVIRAGIIKFKFVLETTKVDDKEKQESYKIYPNPSNGIINIEYNSLNTKNVNLEIVNELGEVMGNFQKQVFIGKNTLNLDITSYPKGIYFIRIKEQNITFKLVKE